jgi:DNA-binding NtrC family response regulator
MGGTECMKQLLKIDPNINVLFSSGYSAASPIGESVEMGARGFVQKPFRMRDLLREVRRALDQP